MLRSQRFGCLSPSSLLAGLLTLLLVAGVGIARGGALFSPGLLNAQSGGQRLGGVASHAETAGRCSACHPAFWEKARMSDRCLNCHQELYGDSQDFHSVMLAQGQARRCTQCHTDHRGSQAGLTLLDLERFPHEGVGYSLKAHQRIASGAAFTCSDCHGETVARFDPAICERCHADLQPEAMVAHRAAFGAGCLACHDGLDTYGKAFDHNQTAFVLQGRHAAADCAGCHAGASTPADLRAAPQSCAGCHAAEDAHGGQFGQDCAACHTPQAWEAATFDHSRTAFPLTGRHAGAPCAGCHTGGVYAGTPQACAACHAEPAFHAGLLAGDCAACHSAEGWTPARFDGPHAFPIDHGEGGPATCRTCHPDSLSAYTCYGCHEHNPAGIAEKHQEEGISNFQDCTRCHPTGRVGEGGEDGEHGGDD